MKNRETTKSVSLDKGEKKTIVVDGGGIYAAKLLGNGAEACIVGGFVLKGNERVKIHTIQHHNAPNTISNLLIKAVLFDKSRLEYDGLIKIEKKAMNANAYQRNENLLMSPNANVSSKPELEIEANEVRCTHGATMGMIDEDQIFYLMTRGIARAVAERMIVEGFFAPVFHKMNESDRKKHKARILSKLESGYN